jgi:FKBP-type peptidyl-prolyl cis-trans isomerase FklB
MAQQLAQQSFEGLCPESVTQGVLDQLTNVESPVTPELINEAFGEINKRMQAEQEAQAKEAGGEGEAFLAENAKRDEVTVTASGLQYEVLIEGVGEKPTATSTVRTHYHGTLISGKVFDSSYDRGEPAEFPVNGVIAGWTEALQMMPIGSKWRLAIPFNLAYGERGAGADIPPFAALVFDVELLAIL